MKNLDKQQYIKGVEEFYLSLKGNFSILTPKENDIILKWYEKDIDIELIKHFIKSEIIKIPQNKRKNFSLIIVDKKIQEKITHSKPKEKTIKKSKWEIVVEKLNLPEYLLKVPEDYLGDKSLYYEKNIISYVWKNMTKEEKEELFKYALKQIEDDTILNTDKKTVIKSIIYTKIKEDLLSKV